MRKSKFTETQIVSILKEVEADKAVGHLCRQHGISLPTYYMWESKYGGLDVSKLKRMKVLEAENAKLKRLFADMTLENSTLKDLIEKSSNAQSQPCCC